MTRIFQVPDPESPHPPLVRPRPLSLSRPEASKLPPLRSLQPHAAEPLRASVPGLTPASLTPVMPVHPPAAPASTLDLQPEPETEGVHPRDLTLAQFFQQMTHLPGLNAGLGMCSDRMPVMLDLTDPRPGPLAVLGNARSGKTSLVQVMLESALALNPGQQVRFVIIAEKPQEYERLSRSDTARAQSLGIFPPGSLEAQRILERLAAQVEHGSAEPVLVCLDDLRMIRTASAALQSAVETILCAGPQVSIWPIAVLSAETAPGLGRWLRRFRTRLIGNMANQAAGRLGIFTGLDAESLVPRRQFSVYLGGEWLPFWVPRLV